MIFAGLCLLPNLLKLVEKARVKATGFSRVDFDVHQALRDICTANPQSLMFGTDMPSTRAPKPYTDEDLLLLVDSIEADLVTAVLEKNALELLPSGCLLNCSTGIGSGAGKCYCVMKTNE